MKVIEQNGDILGDGVNIAARIEPLSDAKGIMITRQVYDQVHNKIEERIVKAGKHNLKNIGTPVELYKVLLNNEKLSSSIELDRHRIAVLPLANMIADPNDQYFADGMTEELISTISKIKELTVISRTSAMKYKDARMPISEIGQELRVGSILEGSARKSGNRVRITEQLIDVNNDSHVWSQSYDRDLSDVFAIQADIAEQVASALRVELLSNEKERIRKKATEKTEAHTMYLKGRYYWNERTEEGVKKALRYFEEAVKIDPEFAPAYSGLADTYSILSDYTWMPAENASQLSKENAMRAVRLDDELAEAHASLGLSLVNFDWDAAGSEREFRRAIELRPSYSSAYQWYGILLFYMRKYQDCHEMFRRAVELDPYSRIIALNFANSFILLDRAGEARNRIEKIIEINPDFPVAHFWKSFACMVLGRHDEAITEAEVFVQMENGKANSKLALAFQQAVAGHKKEAEDLLEEINSRDDASSWPAMGVVRLALGQKKEGYELLEEACRKREPNLLYIFGYPWLSQYWSDPEWLAIERTIGLVKM